MYGIGSWPKGPGQSGSWEPLSEAIGHLCSEGRWEPFFSRLLATFISETFGVLLCVRPLGPFMFEATGRLYFGGRWILGLSETARYFHIGGYWELVCSRVLVTFIFGAIGHLHSGGSWEPFSFGD